MSCSAKAAIIIFLLALSIAFSPVRAGWTNAISLGPIFNSEYDDKDPSISSDGRVLYFASERSGGVGDRDIWVSRRLGWSPQGPVWSPPQNPGPPLNSPYFDADPCISNDGQILYFVSTRPGGMGGADIWASQWTEDGWGAPVNLGAPINTSAWDRSPCVLADGNTIYFGSTRSGGFGDYDLYKTTWAGTEWSQPQNLGPEINTSAQDCFPWVNGDQNHLFFNSWGHGGYGLGDIFYSAWAGAGWGDPTNIGSAINSEAGECSPDLNQDMVCLYFHSSRAGGSGAFDIYVSYFQPEEWGPAANLGGMLNSQYFDGHPSVSPDGDVLYFNSERPGGVGGRDIWVSRRIGWSSSGPLWTPPQNPGQPLNTTYYDAHPCISHDGQKLYFISQRQGGFGGADIWVSNWTEGAWGQPENLGYPVNSSDWEMDPFISADGLTLYFGSTRPGGFGGYDLYKSFVQGAEWSVPENLGSNVNTGENDNGPWVNADETVMFFHSRGHEALGEGDLFCSLWSGFEWGMPSWLGADLNTTSAEAAPTLPGNMRVIYFHSNRPAGFGDCDLYLSYPDDWRYVGLTREIQQRSSHRHLDNTEFILSPGKYPQYSD